MLLTKSCLALSCELGWSNSAIWIITHDCSSCIKATAGLGISTLYESLQLLFGKRRNISRYKKVKMFWQPFYSLVCSVEWSLPCTYWSFVKGSYRYFLKGHWQKCTRQSLKVSWVVFSSLFFERILERLARVVMDVCLQLLKLSKQK